MATKPKTKKKPAKQAPKTGRGRPVKYDLSMNEWAYRFALLGFTDSEIAKGLNVSDATVDNWKKRYPDFLGSINAGKQFADAKVAESLFNSCFDRTVVETQAIKLSQTGWNEAGKKTITEFVQLVEVQKSVPADYRSQSLWLRNRQSKSWRDKVETGITDSDGNDIPMAVMAPTGVLTFKTVQPNAGSTDTK